MKNVRAGLNESLYSYLGIGRHAFCLLGNLIFWVEAAGCGIFNEAAKKVICCARWHRAFIPLHYKSTDVITSQMGTPIPNTDCSIEDPFQNYCCSSWKLNAREWLWTPFSLVLHLNSAGVLLTAALWYLIPWPVRSEATSPIPQGLYR